MMMRTNKDSDIVQEHPFSDFQPVEWCPPRVSRRDSEPCIYSLTRDHGIKGVYRLHNPKDQINEGRNYLDRVIVEYLIDGISYNLFTINDFFEVDYAFDEKGAGNIMGDIAERISRRITKYFLKHFSRFGHTGGIFDERFNPSQRDNFVITHSDQYILKIQNYPNLVILKRTGGGKYGYENIKELDGLFDYRYRKKRHILVLESKLDKINVQSSYLVNNLFAPLRQLFPAAEFSYILFSDKGSIYHKREIDRLRKLKQQPITIYHDLKAEGVGVLYFTFNENRSDFGRIKDHLIAQYRSIARLDVNIYGKMVISDKKIVLFDGGETPRIKLLRDPKTGMWREVKLSHKSRKRLKPSV